jgi:hypothetical protein
MFADEDEHYLRRLTASWPAFGESAQGLAGKIQGVVRRLAVIEPAYGEVRPILAMRRPRPSDPGPVLDMTAEELASLIDRRMRFDPPPFPAPVDQDGYSIVLGPDRSGRDPRRLGVLISGGQYRSGAWDKFELRPHRDSPIWREQDLALSVLDILIDVLDCHCAAAWAFVPEGEGGRRRPWLAWVSQHAEHPLPFPFPFADAPPAPRQALYREGRLHTWP